MSLIFIVELGGTIYLHLKYLFLTPDGVFFGPCSFGWLWLTQTALLLLRPKIWGQIYFFAFFYKKIHGTTKFISWFENNFGFWENYVCIHNYNQINFHLILGFNWKNLEISICPLNLSQFSFIPLKYENQIFFEDFAKECAEHWNNLKIQSTKVETTTKLFEQMTHWLWQFGTPIAAAEGPHHLVQKINALTNKPCPRFGDMYLVGNRQQGRERERERGECSGYFVGKGRFCMKGFSSRY